MKKLLLSTNVITLLALVSILCYNQSCNGGKPTPSVTTASDTAGLTNDECATCYPNACDQSFTGLNAGLAAKMVQDYRENQWQSINGGASVTDSRSVWLSLQTLKRFIHEIEKKVCDTCNAPLTDLGVRIYYAAYPSGTDWNTYASSLAGVQQGSSESRHTIVMVPTYYNTSLQQDVDFDPNYIGVNCQPLTMCQVYDSLKGTTGAITVLTPGNVSMQNHGTMDPPTSVSTFAKVVDEICDGGVNNGGTPVRPVLRDITVRKATSDKTKTDKK